MNGQGYQSFEKGINRYPTGCIIINIVAISMILYHIYNPLWGFSGAIYHRALHLLFAYTLILSNALIMSIPHTRKTIINLFLILATLVTFSYLILYYDVIVSRIVYVTPLNAAEYILGTLAILLVLEISRRTIGWIIAGVGWVALLYFLIGPYLPGLLHHSGYSFKLLLETQYLTTDGMLGLPLAASASYVILFIIFGALLNAFGFDNLLTYFARISSQKIRSGPALFAVIVSFFMGMFSGVATANTAATGNITIPLMKRAGYQSEFAGAVEAAASTGGQLMPPIMGVVIFLMMDYTGIPYVTLMRYLVLPAILYFFSVGLTVHFKAIRFSQKNIGFQDKELFAKKDNKKIIQAKGHLVLSVIVLIVLLLRGFSVLYSVVIAIIFVFLLGMLHPGTRISLQALAVALIKGAHSAAYIASACAVAGLLVGIVNLTGLSTKFSNLVVDISGTNILLALILAMLASLILGMGIPVAAAYIIQIALIIPSLIAAGIDIVAAHLFVIYFCALSFVTPPVALASYVAAGIAQANVLKTSIQATRLTISAYMIPYLFVYYPELLLQGEPLYLVLVFITSVGGIIALTAALEGYLLAPLGIVLRFLLFGIAYLFLMPDLLTDIMGVFILMLVIYINRWIARRVMGKKLSYFF